MDINTKKTSTVSILLFIYIGSVCAQYDFIAQKIIPKGHVKAILAKGNKFLNSKESEVYYSKLINIEFPLIYKYDGNCGNFEILGKTFRLYENYGNELACDLNLEIPEVYKVYRFKFMKRKYYVLECINHGSGSLTSFILIHLFDITSKDNIIYYPLWSRYGSIKCLGDFNNDGILDFLKIRSNEKQTGSDTYKASLMSLNDTKNKFMDIPQSKEWTFKKVYTKTKNIKITMLY